MWSGQSASAGWGPSTRSSTTLTKHHRALKILHAGASASVVERFVREASAAARIGNPHVAETFDAGTLEKDEPYLVMELLDGETLDQRLRRAGPIEPGELSDLIYQACEGIQAAHDAGIVHRDLKPENLFITVRDGEPFVKILDFGISKFDEGRTGALGITEEGSVMGTPYYMSPEQVRASGAIDNRTDIYALGVMLYECACGERPYDASYLAQLAVLIHEGKPTPLAVRRPDLPPAFCAIVHRAMAADRDTRFESARALGEALAPLRVRTYHVVRGTGSGSGAPPPRVVVRPSAPPLGQSGEAPPVSSTVPSGEKALAATVAPDRPTAKAARSRAVAVAAVAVVLAAAGGVGLVARSLKGTSVSVGPAVAVSATATPETPSAGPSGAAREDLPPQSVVLAPLPAAGRSAGVGAGASPDAGAGVSASGGGSGEAASGASRHAAVRSSGVAPAPAPAAPGTSRVDQKGLAGENPFR